MSSDKEPVVHIQEHKKDSVKFILENVDLAYAMPLPIAKPSGSLIRFLYILDLRTRYDVL